MLGPGTPVEKEAPVMSAAGVTVPTQEIAPDVAPSDATQTPVRNGQSPFTPSVNVKKIEQVSIFALALH